tara:strand:+ start:1366 stop:1662 length:297 start_codon:yes stop_codon:yes gene_type:complete
MAVKKSKMEFLEDLDMYDKAMTNAYFIITKRKTLDDLLTDLELGGVQEVALPFDPHLEDGRSADIIDMLVEYFEGNEDYEKCAELTNLKKDASKHKSS